MATTGFWPVKNRLKEVIEYARNPDKTIDKKILDEDIYAALRYVENDKKTDQTMYVSGINCPKQKAYEYMMATKRRYGKLGGNVAYHGYQSFVSGEVTPEEAHQIGLEDLILQPDAIVVLGDLACIQLRPLAFVQCFVLG